LREKINEYAPLYRIGKIEKSMENFTTSEEMKEFIRQMDKKIDNLDMKLVLKAQ
jgi:hypothetical protein